MEKKLFRGAKEKASVGVIIRNIMTSIFIKWLLILSGEICATVCAFVCVSYTLLFFLFVRMAGSPVHKCVINKVKAKSAYFVLVYY